MTAQPRASDVLAALFEPVEGFVELRAKGAYTIAQAFAPTTEIADLAPFVVAHLDDNLYFGASARRTPVDGTRANCAVLPALWADLDGPVTESRQRLARFPFRANVVTHTGRGLQAYWALREGLDLETGDVYLRRLAAHFDGDRQAAEGAHVMRLPGSWNFKYQPARLVTVERFDLAWRVNATELDDFLPVDPRAATHGRTAPLTQAATFAAGDRNGALFVNARRMRFGGFSYDETHAALTVFNQRRCDPPHPDREVTRACRAAFHLPDRPGFTPQAVGRGRARLAPPSLQTTHPLERGAVAPAPTLTLCVRTSTSTSTTTRTTATENAAAAALSLFDAPSTTTTGG